MFPALGPDGPVLGVPVLGAAVLAAALLAPHGGAAQEVLRHPIPDSDFPIAQAVEVPGDRMLVFLSGTVPGIADASADPATPEAWGDMRTQTISVLNTIDAQLKELGLTMGDVVKMQAFLVAPDGDAVDFDGFMAGYSEFFGTEAQPNLPVRSAMVVAALVHPQWLVEI